MSDQPIGFVSLDKLPSGDEIEQVKQEVQTMMDAYDGTLPFPEYVERYMRVHPSRWDYHTLAQFVTPLNDPRNEPAPRHNGKLGEEAYVEYRHYPKNIASPSLMVRVSAECGELTPTEALSLLDWLMREKVTLEQLAKEQTHE